MEAGVCVVSGRVFIFSMRGAAGLAAEDEIVPIDNKAWRQLVPDDDGAGDADGPRHTNYKIGLFNNIDFHIAIPSYTIGRITENGHAVTHQGFGAVTLRSKINLMGNDADGPAVAIFSSIKFPTNQNRLGNMYRAAGVDLL